MAVGVQYIEMALILTALGVFIILLASELWWRYKNPQSELSRKFVHITVGTFVAFWPFFLNWNQIRLLALGFAVTVVVSKTFHIFRAIHSVQRPTWGEVYFALVVGLLTFVTHSKSIYAASLLQMSLADGLAAVVGVRFGKRHRYKVLGHPKSYLGTATFLVVSVLLLVGYIVTGHDLAVSHLIGLAILASLGENFGVAGLDNLFVPLLVALVLTKIG